MLRASLGKVVHTVKRAGPYAAKVPPPELHKIAVHVRAVSTSIFNLWGTGNLYTQEIWKRLSKDEHIFAVGRIAHPFPPPTHQLIQT